MGFKPPRFDLNSPATWDRWARETLVIPDPQSVGANELAPEAVDTAAIAGAAAASNNRFYVKRAGSLVFDAIADADLPAAIARDTEVAAADAVVTAAFSAADVLVASDAASALATHVAASDPHPGYLTAAEGDAAYQPLAVALSRIYSGTGSPEMVVTAGVGSIFLRTDGGAGTSMYVKESGVGNTGWVGK